MTISTAAIKELREKSGAGVIECKNVLIEVCGDMEKAYAVLKEKGLAKAEKKADRQASQGVVVSYIHHNGTIGALVEVNCETDFVAHTTEFKELARDLAMQVAATAPQAISPELGSPELADKETYLLNQPFIKDATKTVQDRVVETSAKVGENVKIRRFARFEVGR